MPGDTSQSIVKLSKPHFVDKTCWIIDVDQQVHTDLLDKGLGTGYMWTTLHAKNKILLKTNCMYLTFAIEVFLVNSL